MSTPTSDTAAIRQIIRALKAAGHTLTYVYDGEEDIPVANETEAIDAITAVDQAHLHLDLAEGTPDTSTGKGYVFFVLGNDPEEVANNYTVSLSPVLDPLTERLVVLMSTDLERGADEAYDRQDQAWFDAQSTEALKILWAQACDIVNRGAAWDDEVYEALAARGYFDTEEES